MDKQKMLSTIEDTIDRIDTFDQECSDSEFTDTGDAWDLFNLIRDKLEVVQTWLK